MNIKYFYLNITLQKSKEEEIRENESKPGLNFLNFENSILKIKEKSKNIEKNSERLRDEEQTKKKKKNFDTEKTKATKSKEINEENKLNGM